MIAIVERRWRMPASGAVTWQRLRAFIQRAGPLGGDGLLALAVSAGSLWLTLFARHHALRVFRPGPALGPSGAVRTAVMTGVFHTPGPPGPAAVLMTVLLTVPLAWRRRLPVIAFGVQAGGMLAVPGDVTIPGFAAVMLGAYSVAVSHRRGWVTLAVLACATALITAHYRQLVPAIPGSVTPLAIMLPVWLAGRSVVAWRVRAGTLRDRALRAERERETALRLAVAEERGRIARDLHDVVSHNVSVMMIQSGAAQEMLRHDPGAAGQALRAVQASGREAMTELRQLLSVLTPAALDPDGPEEPVDAPLNPQPGLDQLGPLIDRVRAAGIPVRLRTAGQARPLPPSADLTAYRVVQEALTNVLKHATGASTQIAITYRADDLTIEVLDDGAPAAVSLARPADASGAGRGLLGLTERLTMCGGELRAGRRLAGGYQVRATIPVTAP